jgi:hypothetical protein
MGASWEVLKRDKELLVFPLLSGICCLAVMASFAIPIWATGSWKLPGKDASTQQQVGFYGVLFLFYFCNYFVITFFNTAIIAGAMARMQGGDPTVAGCFCEAFSRLHLIISWALVSATVGLILRIIEDRSERIGRWVAGLLGMAWTVLCYLVVPIIVVQRKGPVDALKESALLLRKTWGEQIVGKFSFGLVFFVLSLPALALIVMGVYMAAAANNTLLGGLFIGVAVVYWIVLSLMQSALQSIFQAAVYLYALDPALLSMPLADGTRGFPVRLVAEAMGRKE